MSPELIQTILLIFLGAVGATVGSFLNVVIHRVPRGLSVNRPKRSFCPHCETQLKVWQNLPLVSWLLLRGKCASCGEPIAFRYVMVELLTCLLFLWVGVCQAPIADNALLVLGLCAWMALLVAIIFIDLEHMIIPLGLTVSGVVIGLLLGMWQPAFIGGNEWSGGLIDSLIGSASGFFGIWLVVELGKKAFGRKKIECPGGGEWHLHEPENDDEELQFVLGDERIDWSDLFSRDSDKLILRGGSLKVDGKSRGEQEEVVLHYDRVSYARREEKIEDLKALAGTAREVVIPREAMGMGDAHLMAMIGALLGWEAVLFSVFAGSLVGIVVAVLGRLGFGSQIPFGPCLAVGALGWMVGGERLWAWYLELPGQMVAVFSLCF